MLDASDCFDRKNYALYEDKRKCRPSQTWIERFIFCIVRFFFYYLQLYEHDKYVRL